MKKITLDSVKLPSNMENFVIKCDGNVPIEVAIKTKASLRGPKQEIPILGYLAKCATVKPLFRKSETRFTMQRTFTQIKLGSKLNLAKIRQEIITATENADLNPPTIEIKHAIFIIGDTKYDFYYHSPAKAITLKKINGKLIGRLSEEQIQELISPKGHLHFCAPSHCTKVYKEVWECK